MAVWNARLEVPGGGEAVPCLPWLPLRRWAVLLRNDGANPVDIGGPNVGPGEGVALQPGQSLSLDLEGGERPYASSQAGTTLAIVASGVKVPA